jgi:hypothetical protein
MTPDLISLADPRDHPWAVVSIHPTTRRKRVSCVPSRNAAVKLARRIRGAGYVARTWRLDGTWVALEDADRGDEQ